jgi:hypothetical protein
VDWRAADAVFGPAADGGFWALCLRVPDPALLRGVPMPTTVTGTVRRARLLAAGLRVADLPQLRDVGQWRRGNRAFVCASGARHLKEMRSRDESAPSVRDERSEPTERTGPTLPCIVTSSGSLADPADRRREPPHHVGVPVRGA